MIDFLVIGSQKCATSWLYDCLKEHPQICLPKNKREVEYIGGNLYNEKGLSWYLSLLDHCEDTKIKGDVSVEYIVNDVCAELLYAVNPKMKLILNIRNPVERAVSALKWYNRKSNIKDEPETIKLRMEEAIIFFDSTPYKLMEYDLHDVLYRGLYNKLLQNYYRFFDKKNIFIVHYEDIKTNPQKVLKEVFRFLNADDSFVPQSLNSQPKKNSNNKLLIRMERMFPKNQVWSYMIDKLHQIFPENKSYSTDEKEIRHLLTNFYAQRKQEVYIN